ncbi:MAG: 4Fe-4S binding protein [Clostridia bacterium]|nr:4Fe-4S binding protein [Clostridia bacterium]
MKKLTIREDRCKGCGLCVDVCPKKVLELSEKIINKKGHHPVQAVNEEDCISCAFCATMCPDCVITVEKED